MVYNIFIIFYIQIVLITSVIFCQQLFPDYDYFGHTTAYPHSNYELIYKSNTPEYFFSNQKNIRLKSDIFNNKKLIQTNNQQPMHNEEILTAPLMFQTAIPPLIYSQVPIFSKTLPFNILNHQNLMFPSSIPVNEPLPKSTKSFNLPNPEYSRNDGIFSSAEMRITPRKSFLSNELEESKYIPKTKSTALDHQQYNFEEKVLDKILTHLPQLAATVLKLGTSSNNEKTKYYSTTPSTDFELSAPKFTKNYLTKTSGDVDEIASIVNELPKPTSIFSFGKLLSSMERQSVENSYKQSKIEPNDRDYDNNFNKLLNLNTFRGTAILKSKDEETTIKNLAYKIVTPEYRLTNSFENTTPSMLMNLMKPFLEMTNTKLSSSNNATKQNNIKINEENIEKDSIENKNLQNQNIFSTLLNGNFNELIKSSTSDNINTKTKEKRNSDDRNDPNLFTSLLNGKFNEINWVNMILGNNEKTSSNKDREEGNALAQLFNSNGGGLSKLSSLFGSGLDDDPSIPNRSSVKNNF